MLEPRAILAIALHEVVQHLGKVAIEVKARLILGMMQQRDNNILGVACNVDDLGVGRGAAWEVLEVSMGLEVPGALGLHNGLHSVASGLPLAQNGRGCGLQPGNALRIRFVAQLAIVAQQVHDLLAPGSAGLHVGTDVNVAVPGVKVINQILNLAGLHQRALGNASDDVQVILNAFQVALGAPNHGLGLLIDLEVEQILVHRVINIPQAIGATAASQKREHVGQDQSRRPLKGVWRLSRRVNFTVVDD
mmetsp:Transcript_39636/g.61936  ORF Transcript_39636/g.61936 Transcript_39636/m.61936 type:complete len:248 (-) Transcript_39636:2-745(-)